MVNMEKLAGGDLGYQLRITFNKEYNKFFLEGYVVTGYHTHKVPVLDKDGAMLQFDSIEAVIKHLVEFN